MKITRKQLIKLIKESIEQSHMPRVFMHVTAPSGCGKTTLMEKLANEYPQYEFMDTDELAERASINLGLKVNWQSHGWTEEIERKHQVETEKVIADFVENCLSPVVLFGIHHNAFDGNILETMRFNATHKILWDIDKKTCAKRKFSRDYSKAIVTKDGAIQGPSFIMKADWMTPDMDLDDPHIQQKVLEDLELGHEEFAQEVMSLGYQPVDEIGIRTLLTQGLYDPYENASINEGYFTDYAKHATMNLGQVLRHLRYLTDLPDTTKYEALKQRLRFIANDLYYTVVPPQSHHSQAELDEISRFSYRDLLRMGFDPDFAEEMLSNASKE